MPNYVYIVTDRNSGVMGCYGSADSAYKAAEELIGDIDRTTLPLVRLNMNGYCHVRSLERDEHTFGHNVPKRMCDITRHEIKQ